MSEIPTRIRDHEASLDYEIVLIEDWFRDNPDVSEFSKSAMKMVQTYLLDRKHIYCELHHTSKG